MFTEHKHDDDDGWLYVGLVLYMSNELLLSAKLQSASDLYKGSATGKPEQVTQLLKID